LLQARLAAEEIKLKRLHLEARATVLNKQLTILTGLPDGSIRIEHASIPEIPRVRGTEAPHPVQGVEAAQLTAKAKIQTARGDAEISYLPELRFFMQYNRDTNILNNVNFFFAHNLPPNNFSSGVSVQIPIFDMGRRARAKESAAEALRSRVEAEQAEKQNDLAIADLSGSILELDTRAQIASLKQQIAGEQLKTVMAQMQTGNGTGSGPGSVPQTSPRAEQQALIEVRQKTEDALDAGFELAKARLNLLRALGHMHDWLDELHGK
jgi:outer membrane protein TolC